MGALKFVLMLCFLYCAGTAYSQVLAEEDIDIIMNGHEIIERVMSDADTNKGLWARYSGLMLSCFQFIPIGDFVRSKPNINKKELKNNLERLLAVEVPPELDRAYREIGWIENGHVKFNTIFFGTFYMLLMEMINDTKGEYSEDRNSDIIEELERWEDVISVYRTILSDGDMAIIERNKEKLF